MREVEYSEAAVEVLDILNYTNKEDVEKIPQSFIKFLTDIASKNYKAQFNHEQSINELNLKKQTKELLGFIYITWWCSIEEREKYKNRIHTENIKKKEITENQVLNDIFNNKKEDKYAVFKEENTIETVMVEYKKQNIFKKILNRILTFFGSKNERS